MDHYTIWMDLVKLYGIPASQAARCLWTLEELGLAYELIETVPGADTGGAEFALLNPNRKIPVLVDGDLVLWESLAINLYLVQHYESALWPGSEKHRAEIMQWTFWVSHDVEPHLWRLWQLGDSEAGKILARSLSILDSHLRDRQWVVGSAFTIADLNLETYIVRARHGDYDLTVHPHLSAWIRRCEARPARITVRAMIEAYRPGTPGVTL